MAVTKKSYKIEQESEILSSEFLTNDHQFDI